MSYRLLCDENVDPAAVPALSERGFDAIHVTDRPGPSSPDRAVADTAIAEDRLLVTNDDDFLDQSRFPEVHVLYYPENRLSAHEVVERVGKLVSIVPDQGDLPREMFLTEGNVDF